VVADAQDQRRAAREASTAIAMWEEADAATGSLDDEALAQVYLATAQLHLGQLDGAVDALRRFPRCLQGVRSPGS